MSNAEKFLPRYTVEDYQSWKGDWELWEGHAVSMSPSPFADHSKIAVELCRLLGNAIKENPVCREQVNLYTELDWVVADDTVVRPDLSISCGKVFEKHITAPPAVVIEILSNSTRAHDLGFKRALYQSQSVPYYLILDPAAKSFSQFHLGDDGYKDIANGQSASFTICKDCTFEVTLSEVFD